MKKQKFNIVRTAEGTMFEVAFVVLAVAVWAMIVVLLMRAPDTVPVHFSLSGTPDGWGSKYTMVLPCLITTVIGAGMLLGAYFPHTVNLPVSIKNERQAWLVVRMMRIMAILFLLLTLAMGALLSQMALFHTAVPALVCTALIVAVVAVFTFLVYKAK